MPIAKKHGWRMVNAANQPNKAPKKKVFCLLGDLEIELINAPRSIGFKEQNNYVQHDRIDGKPKLQWVGEKLDSMDLAFRFGAGWCDPDAQLQQLRTLKDGRAGLRLTLGSGTFGGFWAIDELAIDLSATDEKGNTILIEVKVRLIEAEQGIPKAQKKLNPFKRVTR